MLKERESEDERPRVIGIAPYDSRGAQSPDWRSFDGNDASCAVPGLPDKWAGASDLVEGEGGTGLPPQVLGCLTGT